jgi:type IV pilus assembly protein PilY1
LGRREFRRRPERSNMPSLTAIARSPRRTAAAVITLALFAFARPSAASETFPAGSVIIPTTAPYQDPCGMVSAYGLVYTILRANDGLDAHPVAGSPFQQRITVHWAFKGTKTSPNRCVPTNLDTPPGSTNTDDPAWNDGCDFQLTNTSGLVAQLIDNTKADSSGDSAILTRNTTTATEQAFSYPNFPQRTVKFNATANNVTKLAYGGGAFIISAADVPALQALVSGKYTHKDISGDNIDFGPYRTGAGSCAYGAGTLNGYSVGLFTTTDPNSAGFGYNLAFANEHYVYMHRAKVSFTADDSARMNGRPPRIALLGVVGGKFDYETAGAPPTGIKGQQLKYYLRSAGLDFASTSTSGSSAGGCQSDSFNVLNNTVCPNGGKSGEVYDTVDAIDIANGVLAKNDSNGNPIFSVLWAPHFQPPQVTSGCNAACLVNALNNIGSFLGQRNRGFMGECATIGMMEGSGNSTTYTLGAGATTQSLSCAKDPSTGNCSTSVTTYKGIDISNDNYTYLRLDNCSDPSTADGVTCIHYPFASSPFAQIGDYRWFSYPGGVSNYRPTGNDQAANTTGTTRYTGTYRSGVNTLAYTIGSNKKSALTNTATARALAVVDNFSYIKRDNSDAKAQVVYLGGHNYTSDVAGTRVALNTVLALGVVLSTAETAFIGPTLYNAKVYVPSYYRITTVSAPVEWRVFYPDRAQSWVFPYHRGAVRSHPLQTGTGTTVDQFTAKVVDDATLVFPKPGARNLFTYLGGTLSSNTLSAAPVPRGIPNGIAQLGWTPVKFDVSEITGGNCVNNMRIGAYNASAADFTDATGYAFPHRTKSYAGMVPISSQGDYPGGSICDLEEAMEVYSPTSLNLGGDYGASSASQTLIYNFLADPDYQQRVSAVVNMVRGFCYATATKQAGDSSAVTGTVNYTPTATDCNDISQLANLNNLGGFVHSQAAIIPDSPYINSQGTGKKRPTVLFVGGLDGQLHAFYVPRGDSADSGYSGPATAVTTLTGVSGGGSASSKFNTRLVGSGGSFSPPAALTELWAFIPPGQLPYLHDNSARVDSSPAVIDVFGDFDGTGIRQWHTVLVASAGGQNRELFALDITNPLDPVMLWDIQSSFDPTSMQHAPTQLSDDDTGFNALCNGATGCISTDEAYQWQNACTYAASIKAQTTNDPAPPCKTAIYQLPPNNDQGRISTGLFNYTHLGSSASVSVAALRRNNAPVFAAFVATNEPSGNGIYVFAIDVVTGQKLWEWNNPYDQPTLLASDPVWAAGLGNTPPAGVSLLSKAGNSIIDTAYVGDDLGNFFELDANDGLNTTSYAKALAKTDGTANFPLVNAYYSPGSMGPQPVSTLATIFTVPWTIPLTSSFNASRGQTLVAFGTSGTDTVAAYLDANGSSTDTGNIHILPVSANGRLLPSQVSGTSTAWTKGVGLEVSGFPRSLNPSERAYGSLVAAGDTLYFATSAGAVADIDKRGQPGLISGSVYSLSLNAPAASMVTQLSTGNGGTGGTPLVDTSVAGKVTVVTVTDQRIVTTVDTNANGSAPPVNSPHANLLGYIIKSSGHVN